ncbi:MAG: hypothetical protein RPT11_11265 [Bermanella sp.]
MTMVPVNVPTKPPLPVPLMIEVSSKGFTVLAKEVAIKQDVENSLKKTFAAVPYLSQNFIGGVLVFGSLDSIVLTEKFTKGGKPLVLAGTLEFTLNASPPAMDPASGSPDPNSQYKVSVDLKAMQVKCNAT